MKTPRAFRHGYSWLRKAATKHIELLIEQATVNNSPYEYTHEIMEQIACDMTNWFWDEHEYAVDVLLNYSNTGLENKQQGETLVAKAVQVHFSAYNQIFYNHTVQQFRWSEDTP